MILESYIKQKIYTNGQIPNIASFFLFVVAGLTIFVAGLCLAVFFLPCVVLGGVVIGVISPVIGSYVAFKYVLKKIAYSTCWDQKQCWSLCHVRRYVHRYIIHNTVMKSIFSSTFLVACSVLYFLMFSFYFFIKSCIDTVRYILEGFMVPFTVCFALYSRNKGKGSALYVEQERAPSKQEEEMVLLAPSSVPLNANSKLGKKKVCKHYNVIAMEGVIKKSCSKRTTRAKSLKERNALSSQ